MTVLATAGDTRVPPAGTSILIPAPGISLTFANLTSREVQVLRLVAEGYTNREVAHALVIGAATVKRHLDNVFAKLGVSSRTAAAAVAIRCGLL